MMSGLMPRVPGGLPSQIHTTARSPGMNVARSIVPAYARLAAISRWFPKWLETSVAGRARACLEELERKTDG